MIRTVRVLATAALVPALACIGDGSPSAPDARPVVRGDTTPLLVGGQRTFTGAATTWLVNGVAGGTATVGTIDATGRYTAPELIPLDGPVRITARDAAGSESTPVRVPITPAPLEGEWYSWQPRVTRHDRSAPVLLTVRPAAGVTRVVLEYSGGGELELSHAAPGLFQGAIPAARVLSRYVPGEHRSVVGFIDHYTGPSRVARINAIVNVRDPAVPDVAVATEDDGARSTPHVLNLRWPGIATGITSAEVARRLYDVLPDDYDFIAMVWPVALTHNRYFSVIRNDTRGIGLPPIDNGRTFGSAARLQGTVQYPLDVMFDLGSGVTSHELGHRWINHLPLPALRPGGAHWPLGDVAYGVMGFSIPGSGAGGMFPFGLDSIAPDRYRVRARPFDGRYNMFELYLAGLAEADEVPPFFVFADQGQLDRLVDGGEMLGPVHRFTMDSVIAAVGPREPAAGTAQRDFRLATVVLSLGRFLDPDEMAFFEHMAARGEATEPLIVRDGLAVDTALPFALATRGRATLTTRLR